MARRPSPANTREFSFPPNNGVVTGWEAVGLGVAGIAWVVLGLDGIVAVRVGIGSLLLIVLAYAFMLRPRINVRDGVLTLVNPLEDVAMPLTIVDRVLVRSSTKVYVGKKVYTAVAVGRKVRHMVGTNRPAPDQIPDLLEEWVYQLVKDARLEPAEPGAAVRRTPTWWLIAPVVLLSVALVVGFLL